MSTIRELLNKYIAKDSDSIVRFLHQIQLNQQLKNDLEKLAQQFIAVRFYLDSIKYLALESGSVSVDSVCGFFEKFGVTTIDQFNQFNTWLSSEYGQQILRFFGEQLQVSIQTLDISGLPKVSVSDLKDIVLNLIPETFKESYLQFKFKDNEYILFTEDLLQNFIEISLTDKLKYIPERRDCDDFARLLKCGLYRYAKGNMALAYLAINLYGENFQGLWSAHAINLTVCVTSDGNYKVKLIEPQTDTIMDFGDTVITTKYYKCRLIDF